MGRYHSSSCLAACLKRLWTAFQSNAEARILRDTLCSLDDRLLRDAGIERAAWHLHRTQREWDRWQL